ncbi:DUF2306 domain-containing protein [Flavobacterium sp.]|uniref:DUF2306 domain-containing protein n=1 Tax=Flavobacterium sp. TaxID=239 RepID=UPI00286BAD41|nr:DUF2306 domain-containing protein [Flavobacterium sp.]
MNQSNIFAFTKPKSYLRLGFTLFLILFAGKFIIKDALPYFGFEQETFGHYWDFKWALIGHISCGLLALVLGPFQFWKAFRNKYLTVHRWSGRIYLTAILIGTLSSTSLAWTSSIQVNFAWAFGLQGLAFAWITTASMAYISVRRKHIQQHKEWMIRSYVVTFAFVTFRWLNELTIVKNLMPEFVERGPTVIWFCWTIPLLITEIVLSWNKK